MKKSLKRLVLNRETLKHLGQPELAPVLGGNTGTCLQSCQWGCTTFEKSACKVCEPQ